MNKGNDFQNKERRARRSSKRREMALLLPILGVVFFATPVLDIFSGANETLGSKVTYIFGCWIGLIVLALAVSRLLRLELRKR